MSKKLLLLLQLALPLLFSACQSTPETEVPTQVQLLGRWDVTKIEHSTGPADTTDILFGITQQLIDESILQNLHVEFFPNDSLHVLSMLPEEAGTWETCVYHVRNGNQLLVKEMSNPFTIQSTNSENLVLTYPEERNGRPSVATWTLRRL